MPKDKYADHFERPQVIPAEVIPEGDFNLRPENEELKAALSGDPKRTVMYKMNMLNALKASLGNVSASAEAANISTCSHYLWMKKDPEYKRRVDELENRNLDFAETSLFKNIKNGKEASLIFYLKTRGKKRGYIESHHHVVEEVKTTALDTKTDEELTIMLREAEDAQARAANGEHPIDLLDLDL